MSVQDGEALHESAILTRPLVIADSNIRVCIQIDDVLILAHILSSLSGLDPSLYQQ